ncbi:hypothetical protein BH23VER1_BH23VER1_22930 [soil metagenome]
MVGTPTMTSPSLQLCQAAYQSAFSGMETILAKADTAEDVLGATGEGLEGLDASLIGANHLAETTIDCRAGCSFCCSLRIDVRAHEVFLLARFLKATRSKDEVEAIRQAAEGVREQVQEMTDAQRNASTIPCVLLSDGRCSVYEARPAACRRYFSASATACEALLNNPAEPAQIQHPFVQDFGRYVANGIHNAFFRSGFDAYSYDLPSALAEALAEPVRELRWFARLKAFSQKAESKVPEGFSQKEAVERLQNTLPPEPQPEPEDDYIGL